MEKPIPHIGETIREQLYRNGQSVVWLAKQLNCQRTSIYRIFDSHSIDLRLLENISIILRHNFLSERSDVLSKKIEKSQ
ncbi:MAG: helix-turn-helix domain-containing protein [Prevotellaceae bacterium]|nr:helix-turn-helix domain-containing protein [Prevotellaceae bacterium]